MTKLIAIQTGYYDGMKGIDSLEGYSRSKVRQGLYEIAARIGYCIFSMRQRFRQCLIAMRLKFGQGSKMRGGQNRLND